MKECMYSVYGRRKNIIGAPKCEKKYGVIKLIFTNIAKACKSEKVTKIYNEHSLENEVMPPHMTFMLHHIDFS